MIWRIRLTVQQDWGSDQQLTCEACVSSSLRSQDPVSVDTEIMWRTEQILNDLKQHLTKLPFRAEEGGC